MLGTYATAVEDKKQTKQIPRGVKIAITTEEKLALAVAQNYSDCLVVYKSLSDETVSTLLHNNFPRQFALVGIKETNSMKPEGLWSWISRSPQPLRKLTIPDTVLKQSQPSQQHEIALDKFLEFKKYQPIESPDRSNKQTLKLSDFSDQLHRYAKQHCSFHTMLLTQTDMHILLKNRNYSVVRPGGTRKVSIWQREKKENI